MFKVAGRGQEPCTRSPCPQRPSRLLLGAPVRRHVLAHSLLVSAGQLTENSMYSAKLHGGRGVHPDMPLQLLAPRPLSLLPIWWSLPPLCHPGVQMASPEVGTVRGSKGTKCHLEPLGSPMDAERGRVLPAAAPPCPPGLESGPWQLPGHSCPSPPAAGQAWWPLPFSAPDIPLHLTVPLLPPWFLSYSQCPVRGQTSPSQF